MKTYTIKDFDKQFPTNDACLEFLFNARYPQGAFCEKCGKILPIIVSLTARFSLANSAVLISPQLLTQYSINQILRYSHGFTPCS